MCLGEGVTGRDGQRREPVRDGDAPIVRAPGQRAHHQGGPYRQRQSFHRNVSWLASRLIARRRQQDANLGLTLRRFELRPSNGRPEGPHARNAKREAYPRPGAPPSPCSLLATSCSSSRTLPRSCRRGCSCSCRRTRSVRPWRRRSHMTPFHTGRTSDSTFP